MSFDVSGAPPLPGPVFFDRRELTQILSVYGRLVAAAEARDYALSDGREAAEFAVFRRTGDAPPGALRNVPRFRLARASGRCSARAARS